MSTATKRTTTMEPLYLSDVEANPKGGAWAESIRLAQETGGEYPQIWHLFAYMPEVTNHIARFTHELLRGDSPLTTFERELIATYTSSKNQCQFCMRSHAAITAEIGGDEELVWAVINDLETAPLDEKLKTLLRYAEKITLRSHEITADDMRPMRQAGWSDEAIYVAGTVSALFNFYNRWIHANGVHRLSDAGHRAGGVRTAKHGYKRD